MSQLRQPAAHTVDAAIEELLALAAGLRGVTIVRASRNSIAVTAGRHRWECEVAVRDALSESDALALIDSTGHTKHLLVANKISSSAKDRLASTESWSWFDRRGELQLLDGSASVLASVESKGLARGTSPGVASARSMGAIRGRAGISYAAALLMRPDDEPPSVRAIAERAEMSHGAIGAAVQLLRKEGLVRQDGRPAVPDLFWALAAAWGPTVQIPVGKIPSATEARSLRANAGSLDAPGWCIGGDQVALAWGAQMLTGRVIPKIWVPSMADARRAIHRLRTSTWDEHKAVIAVAPTALVCGERLIPRGSLKPGYLPMAHPVFSALDLATDPSRGREVLDHWRPTGGELSHVW